MSRSGNFVTIITLKNEENPKILQDFETRSKALDLTSTSP